MDGFVQIRRLRLEAEWDAYAKTFSTNVLNFHLKYIEVLLCSLEKMIWNFEKQVCSAPISHSSQVNYMIMDEKAVFWQFCAETNYSIFEAKVSKMAEGEEKCWCL